MVEINKKYIKENLFRSDGRLNNHKLKKLPYSIEKYIVSIIIYTFLSAIVATNSNSKTFKI